MPEVDSELYKLITIGGEDAVEFLQGQLTQDLNLFPAGGELPAAWCNPKGRVVTTIKLVKTDREIGLIVPANLADQLVRRLTMYRLRSKVDIGEPTDGWKELIDAESADPVALILAGIPTIDESNTEQFTPHMLNLDKLGAISFAKGCYTGQEVIARTENLGKSKRRLMRYAADSDGISVGDKLADGERNVGEVVNVAGRDLLAVTPTELHRVSLKIDDIVISPTGLQYLE